jgi:hypothetical protein
VRFLPSPRLGLAFWLPQSHTLAAVLGPCESLGGGDKSFVFRGVYRFYYKSTRLLSLEPSSIDERVARQLAVAGAWHMSQPLPTQSHGVMDAMFSLGEPHVANNDCLNTAMCCCYGIHHLIYYFISM